MERDFWGLTVRLLIDLHALLVALKYRKYLDRSRFNTILVWVRSSSRNLLERYSNRDEFSLSDVQKKVVHVAEETKINLQAWPRSNDDSLSITVVKSRISELEKIISIREKSTMLR